MCTVTIITTAGGAQWIYRWFVSAQLSQAVRQSVGQLASQLARPSRSRSASTTWRASAAGGISRASGMDSAVSLRRA